MTGITFFLCHWLTNRTIYGIVFRSRTPALIRRRGDDASLVRTNLNSSIIVPVEALPDCYIVSATFYTSFEDPRFKLACRMVEVARAAGYEVVIADGSPNEAIANEFRARGARVLWRPQLAMGQRRRRAIQHAYDLGAKYFAWLEPEKYTLIRELHKCFAPIIAGKADFVIPRRMDLGRYPVFQALCEYQANHLAASITGLAADWWMGPKVFGLNTALMMLNYAGEFGDQWESVNNPLIVALHYGHKGMSVDVDYEHPEEQRGEDGREMRQKRVEQLNEIITNMWRQQRQLGGLPACYVDKPPTILLFDLVA